MPHKIIFSLLVATLITVSQTAYAFGPFKNRFSMTLEYTLMDACVESEVMRNKSKRIEICACAMTKTQENGIWPDYDNDEDFYEDDKEFTKGFGKNLKPCIRDLL